MITERKIQDDFYYFNRDRFSTIIPNCYPPRWYECDLLAITKASYMYEYEIKLSRSDYFNDAKKGKPPEHLKKYYARYDIDGGKTKHQSLSEGSKNGPSKFWYITPENLISAVEIPDFAGWITFIERINYIIFTERIKAPRLHKNKLGEECKDSLRQKLYHRYWNERCNNRRIA